MELEYKTNPPEAFLADFHKLLEKYPEISVQLHIDEPAAAGSNGKYSIMYNNYCIKCMCIAVGTCEGRKRSITEGTYPTYPRPKNDKKKKVVLQWPILIVIIIIQF